MGFWREVTADGPLLFFPFTGRWNGDDQPINYGSSSVGPVISAGFTHGVRGPNPERRGLRLSGGRISHARVGVTANQSRLAWVRTTNTSSTKSYDGDSALTIFGDTSGSVWDSFGVHGGKARFTRFNNSAWQFFDSDASVADGKWHHIGVTYDSTSRAVVIYVDGLANGAGGTMTAHQAQGGVNVVGRGFTNDFFDGDLADAELHNTVLSAQRVLARYRASRVRTPMRRGGMLAA